MNKYISIKKHKPSSFYWWFINWSIGWASILDGLIAVVTFGKLDGYFSIELMTHRLRNFSKSYKK